MSINSLLQPQAAQAPQFYGPQQFPQAGFGEQGFAPQMPPSLAFAQQQFAAVQQHLAQLVSDTVLRVTSAALATVLDQVRIDPQAQQSLCAQGQLSPQAYSSVLAESARRAAPIVSAVVAQLAAQLGAAQQPMAAQWPAAFAQLQQGGAQAFSQPAGQGLGQPAASYAIYGPGAFGPQPSAYAQGFAPRPVPAGVGW